MMMNARAGEKHLSLAPMELVVLVLWRQLDKAVLGFPGQTQGREQEGGESVSGIAQSAAAYTDVMLRVRV